jgi:hypothetical protein
VSRGILAVCAVCAMLVLAIPCLGGNDQEFHAVVSAIETQYGAPPMRIPMLGFATFCLRLAGTPVTAGLKIAVFENIRRANEISSESLEQSIQMAVGDRWKPLVRVRSRDDGELTMVYTNPGDKQLKVLVVAIEEDQATVVQARVKASQMRKWMRAPEAAGDLHGELSADMN